LGPKEQIDIEGIAAVAAVVLETQQLAVAIDLGVPPCGQGPAQRGRREARRPRHRPVGDEQPAPNRALAGERARERGHVACSDLGCLERAEEVPFGIVPECAQAQRGWAAERVRCRAALKARAPEFAGGVQLVSGLSDHPKSRLAAESQLDHGVGRRRAPGAIGQLRLRQQTEVERLVRAKSRGATFALDRLEERQRLVAGEQKRRIRQVWLEAYPEPARQAGSLDAPAFGSIVHLVRTHRSTFVHGLYRILLAIEDERLVLREQPPGCAARLLVEPHRQVERLDEVGEIHANAARGLIAAQGVADAVVAAAQGEQQRVVVVGLPLGGRCRAHGGRRKAGANQRQPTAARKETRLMVSCLGPAAAT
jgi:hypothetical protein